MNNSYANEEAKEKPYSFAIETTANIDAGLNETYFTWWVDSTFIFKKPWYQFTINGKHQQNFQVGQYLSALIPLANIQYKYIYTNSMELENIFTLAKYIKLGFTPTITYGELHYYSRDIAIHGGLEFELLEFEFKYSRTKVAYIYNNHNIFFNQINYSSSLSLYINNIIAIDANISYNINSNENLKNDYKKFNFASGPSFFIYNKHIVFLSATYGNDTLDYDSYGLEVGAGLSLSDSFSLSFQAMTIKNKYSGPSYIIIQRKNYTFTIPMEISSYYSYSFTFSLEYKI